MPHALKKAQPPAAAISEDELRVLEEQYCSFGDTVHYMEQPKFFHHCDGSFIYDAEDRPFLDLQMWYSAVNFGYRNRRLNDVAHRQLDTLPQVASQYLHREKVELATWIARDMENKFHRKGRVHFNVGGAQAVEDSLKLVRNYTGGKSLMFAFEGGYHGRTLGASAITSSYRYRRRYGHFGDRAQFIEFPYHFRGPKGMSKEEYGELCVKKFARLFETEYNGVLDVKTGQAEYAAFYIEPIQGTGGYVIPPKNFFPELKKVLDQHGILLVVDEIQMGVYRTQQTMEHRAFWCHTGCASLRQSHHQRSESTFRYLGTREMINPQIFPARLYPLHLRQQPHGHRCRAETLRMCEEENFEQSVAEKGARFLAGIQELQKRHKIIGDTDGLGLALRIEVCKEDSFTPDKATLDWIAEEGMKGDILVDGKKYGLVLDVGGYYKNVITLAPALTISNAEIDLALRLLDELFTRAKKRV